MTATVTETEIGLAPIHIGDGNYSSKYPKASEFLNSGVPFISASDFVNGRISSSKFRYISPQQHSELRKGHLKANDVLIVSRGNGIGQVAWVDKQFEGCNINAQLVLLRADEKEIHSRYLYFLLSSPEYFRLLKEFGSGSAQPQLTISSLTKVPIKYPKYSEQIKIADLLASLDDKIQSNNRVNETLESMARVIFKEWFIDFGPVKNKAEGKKPFGMDDETASLFPDIFENSAIGALPKGWKIAPLKEITSYVSRGISPKYVEDNGVTVFNQKCVRNGIVLSEPSRLHDANARSVEGRLLKHLDILVNSTGTGTLGRVGQIWNPDKSIVDSHITVVRPNPETYSAILLGLFCRIREPEIEALGEGSTGQTELSRTRLSELQFIVPPVELQSKAEALIGPMMEQKYSNLSETQTLIKMRDLLLPKLISGELQLSEVANG